MSIESITKKLKKIKISNNDIILLVNKMKKMNKSELRNFEHILNKRNIHNQTGGNNNIKVFNMYGKKIKVISVNHNISLDNNIFHTLFNNNTIFFLEESIDLNQIQIINKLKNGEIYDETTKKIINKLLLSNENNNKIIGWDVRPTILKGQDQTGLYGQDKKGIPFFILQTKNEIINRYIDIMPKKYFNKSKYQIFLNKQVPNMNYFDLITQGYIKQNLIDKVLYNLREDYKDISDDYIIEKLLSKYQDYNINIIVGSKHFNSLNTKINIEIRKKHLYHQMMGILTDIQES